MLDWRACRSEVDGRSGLWSGFRDYWCPQDSISIHANRMRRTRPGRANGNYVVPIQEMQRTPCGAVVPVVVVRHLSGRLFLRTQRTTLQHKPPSQRVSVTATQRSTFVVEERQPCWSRACLQPPLWRHATAFLVLHEPDAAQSHDTTTTTTTDELQPTEGCSGGH
jgi:hypothetical protein